MISPYYQDEFVTLYHGDCRDILPLIRGVSAVVTDPPYEIGFMGKSWDNKGISFQPETWAIIRRACLPGAILLCFGGTRTYHRIACAIEDAGWEIRDTLMWVYGSGFPKSLSIGKAVDKQSRKIFYGLSQLQGKLNEKRLEKGLTLKEMNRLFGVADNSGCAAHKFCDKSQPQFPTREQMRVLDDVLELKGELWELYDEVKREIVGYRRAGLGSGKTYAFTDKNYDAPNEVEVTLPATDAAWLWEGYGTGLKPSWEPVTVAMNPLDGTFAENALKHGVAGLNIDGCRVGIDGGGTHCNNRDELGKCLGHPDRSGTAFGLTYHTEESDKPQGRFPANFIHDGSQAVMELFPETKSGKMTLEHKRNKSKSWFTGDAINETYGDNGSAARFFYCAKASQSERGVANNHATVKPLALMEYLCKLVQMPEYNLVLDPFCGSGTTLLACKKLGIPVVGLEMEERYCEIAKKRVERVTLPFLV